MNLGLRLEWLMARLSYQVAKATGANAQFAEMLRFNESIDDEQDMATLDDMFKLVRSSTTVKK